MKNVADQLKEVKDQIKEVKEKVDSLDFDAHWYRRIFHTFGACIVIYYVFPSDIYWISHIKFWVPIALCILVLLLELLRIKGVVNSKHFFGLRMYEKNRAGSYVFFAVAAVILLLFFPQQIAVPCILCACIADPVIGELRHRIGKNNAAICGFFLCMIFFIVNWYKADLSILLLISIIGAFGAITGEIKKFWWLDDDFMIQMIPAVLILVILTVANFAGINILPDPVIQPIVWPR
jgi:dolichol kinase